MTDLTDPTSKEIERLDYVWLRGRRNCNIVAPTGLFNATTRDERTRRARVPVRPHRRHRRAPVRDDLGAAIGGRGRDDADAAVDHHDRRGPATPRRRPPSPSAFTTVFDGSVTSIDKKLAAIEDADRLKPFFLQSYAAQKAIASRIKLRIDRIAVTDATHADVEYSLLLDGAAVLDHLPGGAVKVGDAWLVTRKTYCDVSTQGAKTIPEPCR